MADAGEPSVTNHAAECIESGCRGVRIGAGEACLAHLSDSALARFLGELEPGGNLKLRGTRLGRSLLRRVLTQFRSDDGSTALGDVDFSDCTFPEDASFEGVRFEGSASFEGTEFAGEAKFARAIFVGTASFWVARFLAGAKFHYCRFESAASFPEVRFEKYAAFTRTTFCDVINFDGVEGREGLYLLNATLEKACHIGPLALHEGAEFNGAQFKDSVIIEISSPRADLSDCRFFGGGRISFRHTDVVADNAVFAEPTVLTSSPHPFLFYTRFGIEELDESIIGEIYRERDVRLLSARGINGTNLALFDLDLSWCLFRGARQLDKVFLGEGLVFELTPRGIRFGRMWPPIKYWTRRNVLEEERTWRASAGADEWDRDGKPMRFKESEPIRAGDIALLYRLLRKALEDSKNEPAAADFYYGEMEMRRCSDARLSDRIVLYLYWLTSGYGLRFLRPILCLAVTLAASAILLYFVGYKSHSQPFDDNLVAVLQSAVSIEPKASVFADALTNPGQLIRILLKVSGPLFIGLTLLSIRNRIKR
jgi:uncharacterized protein YjbI with pentapeptide repeats